MNLLLENLGKMRKGWDNMGNPQKVFDWNKAAKLIVENSPQTAIAGLSGDWGSTCGEIWDNDLPVKESYAYLSSNWATPVLIMDDGDEIPCYIMETETEWNSGTIWPQSALDIVFIDVETKNERKALGEGE
jgi:hypothetical protein